MRNRPFVDFTELSMNTILNFSYSFPSTHALSSAAGFFLLKDIVQNKILILSLFLISILISISRILLKMHYFSDVAAGYFLGLLLSFGLLFLFKKVVLEKRLSANEISNTDNHKI